MFLAAARRRAVGGTPEQTKVLAEIFSTLGQGVVDLNAVRNGYQRLNEIEQTDFVRSIKALMESLLMDADLGLYHDVGRSHRRLHDRLEKHLHTNLGDVWKRDPSTELIRELVDHPINFNEMENLRNRVNELAISQLQQPSRAPVGRFAVKISRLLRQAIAFRDEAIQLGPRRLEEGIRAAKQMRKIKKDINEAAEQFVQTHLRGGMRGGRRDEIGIRQHRLNSLQHDYQQRQLDDQPVDTAEYRHLQRELDDLGATPTPFQLNQWDERFNRLRDEVEAAHVLLSLS